MATVTAKYLGDLRVECTHVASGTKLVSDAPVDNNGKGEAFSPTDLCVTALASAFTARCTTWTLSERKSKSLRP